MKVKELISLLQEYDESLDVWNVSKGFIDGVEFDQKGTMKNKGHYFGGFRYLSNSSIFKPDKFADVTTPYIVIICEDNFR